MAIEYGDLTSVLDIIRLTPEFSIGPQISAVDFEHLKSQGFSSILNARPDNEAGNFLKSGEAASMAKYHSLVYHHCPVENHALFEPEYIDAFETALVKLPKPIFSHCKSGTRAAILWALVAARHRPVDEVISILNAAGQELEFLEQELQDSANAVKRSPLRLRDDALLKLGRSNLFGVSKDQKNSQQ